MHMPVCLCCSVSSSKERPGLPCVCFNSTHPLLLFVYVPAGTHRDELDHLEGVISRVCNFHVAESKPVQVPGPDQVGT